MPQIPLPASGDAPDLEAILPRSGSDRRQAPRLPRHTLPGTEEVSLFPGEAAARLIDISRTGALLEAAAPLALGQPSAVVIGDSVGEQRIAGRVVRSETIPSAVAPGLAYRAAISFDTPLAALPLASRAHPPADDEPGGEPGHVQEASDGSPPEVTRAPAATDAEGLYRLAMTDHLTGCYNRRFFEDVIVRELGRHRRYGMPLAVLFIDVDDLKQVNDSHGHLEGDRVLKDVAQFLSRHTRGSDYVFRWGGDEFLVLSGCTREQANQKAAQLKTAFADVAAAKGLPRGVGLSVGCAEFGADHGAVDEVVRLADQRMYDDKTRRCAGGRLDERAAVDRDREVGEPPAAVARSTWRREEREEWASEAARFRELLSQAEAQRVSLLDAISQADARFAAHQTEAQQQLRALAAAVRAVGEQIRAVAGRARSDGQAPGAP